MYPDYSLRSCERNGLHCHACTNTVTRTFKNAWNALITIYYSQVVVVRSQLHRLFIMPMLRSVCVWEWDYTSLWYTSFMSFCWMPDASFTDTIWVSRLRLFISASLLTVKNRKCFPPPLTFTLAQTHWFHRSIVTEYCIWVLVRKCGPAVCVNWLSN